MAVHLEWEWCHKESGNPLRTRILLTVSFFFFSPLLLSLLFCFCSARYPIPPLRIWENWQHRVSQPGHLFFSLFVSHSTFSVFTLPAFTGTLWNPLDAAAAAAAAADLPQEPDEVQEEVEEVATTFLSAFQSCAASLFPFLSGGGSSGTFS